MSPTNAKEKAMKTRKADSNYILACDHCGKSMNALEQSHLTNEDDGSQSWMCDTCHNCEHGGEYHKHADACRFETCQCERFA